jgi:hypothetical protein
MAHPAIRLLPQLGPHCEQISGEFSEKIVSGGVGQGKNSDLWTTDKLQLVVL